MIGTDLTLNLIAVVILVSLSCTAAFTVTPDVSIVPGHSALSVFVYLMKTLLSCTFECLNSEISAFEGGAVDAVVQLR